MEYGTNTSALASFLAASHGEEHSWSVARKIFTHPYPSLDPSTSAILAAALQPVLQQPVKLKPPVTPSTFKNSPTQKRSGVVLASIHWSRPPMSTPPAVGRCKMQIRGGKWKERII
jgi:hypothetical protein